MSKTRKISLWTAGALGTLIFLPALAMFALPLLLDRRQVKEMIHSRLSHQVGGKFDIRSRFMPIHCPSNEPAFLNYEMNSSIVSFKPLIVALIIGLHFSGYIPPLK